MSLFFLIIYIQCSVYSTSRVSLSTVSPWHQALPDQDSDSLQKRLMALRYKQRPWNQNLSVWREIYRKTLPLYFITAISLFSPLIWWQFFLLYASRWPLEANPVKGQYTSECVWVSNLCVLVCLYVCGLTMLQARTAVQFCGLKYNKIVIFVLIR